MTMHMTDRVAALVVLVLVTLAPALVVGQVTPEAARQRGAGAAQLADLLGDLLERAAQRADPDHAR